MSASEDAHMSSGSSASSDSEPVRKKPRVKRGTGPKRTHNAPSMTLERRWDEKNEAGEAKWQWLGCTRAGKPLCIPCNKILNDLHGGTLHGHDKGKGHIKKYASWKAVGYK